MKSLQHYIDGRWVEPVVTGARFPVIDPATESQVAEICMGSAADVDLAVAAACRAFASFAVTPLDARLDALRRINEVFKRRFDEMADAITTEMGAPRDMARGITDGLEELAASAKEKGGRVTLDSGFGEIGEFVRPPRQFET